MSTYSTEFDIRYRDLDTNIHVNNAVYATYLEQARVGYFRDVLGTDLSSVSTVLASLSIQFRRPIELEEGSVVVDIDVPTLGTSSIPMEYEIRTEAGVAAEAEATMVGIDEDTGESTPIPDTYRAAITNFHDI